MSGKPKKGSVIEVRRQLMKASANVSVAHAALAEVLSFVATDEVEDLVTAVTALRAIVNSTSADGTTLRGIARGALVRMRVPEVVAAPKPRRPRGR